LATVALPLAKKLTSSYSPNILSSSKRTVLPSPNNAIKTLSSALASEATARILGYHRRIAATSIIVAGFDKEVPAVCVTTPRGDYFSVCVSGEGFDIGGKAGPGIKIPAASSNLKQAAEEAMLGVLVDGEEGEAVEIAVVTLGGTLFLEKEDVRKMVRRIRNKIGKV
jgi:hypothetical protein